MPCTRQNVVVGLVLMMVVCFLNTECTARNEQELTSEVVSYVHAASAKSLQKVIRPRQRILAEAQQKKCLWDDTDGCALNPLYASVLPKPTTPGGKLVARYAYRYSVCNAITTRTTCNQNSLCEWDDEYNICDVGSSPADFEDLICKGSVVYTFLVCPDLMNATACNANPYCEYKTISGYPFCLGKGVGDISNATQLQQFQQQVASFDPAVWTVKGQACPGYDLIKSIGTLCRSTNQTGCLSDSRCEWTGTEQATRKLSQTSPIDNFVDSDCSLSEDGSFSVIVGSDAFGTQLKAAVNECGALTTNTTCQASSSFTPNTAAIQEFSTVDLTTSSNGAAGKGAGFLLASAVSALLLLLALVA